MKHHIFLSYSRKDSDVMQRVRRDLNATGLLVWTDEGIEPGTRSWKQAIEGAIIDAGCLVCILSPDAKVSTWVQAELDHAELHGKPVFLILARGDERSAIPFGFAAFQWVDIRADGQYNAGMERLIGTVKRRLGAEANTEETRTHTRQDINSLPQQPPDVSGILPPPFEWCEIPAGKVTLTDVGGYLGGYLKEPTTFELGRYWMAKYPITNTQFQVFVDAHDGYRDEGWWDYSAAAQTWRNQNPEQRPPPYAGDDLPRTDVTWYEAVAFCRWLSVKAHLVPWPSRQHGEAERGGLTIRLAGEQEWQRAAQGNDGREYPWGNRFDKARANTFESGIGTATPVTRFPGGSSPFGVMDTCGNVWEWCLTDLETGSLDTTINGPRVLRGGSWGDLQHLVRCAVRAGRLPIYRDIERGFRIVAVPAI